ncbi:Protein VASCULAR ASSOCIATED DEATH 1, chloroplastic [Glycine soja]|uniref:Protein VASCULAR ASSOCIATED DEATH 1, chloroplastic n=1 Tax=Glycine soja TaxID=3848 RepID=A0A445F1X3_GLYSO|nr:Protein VASCULAR ASSOCIATED DEATH 1, chloroplastic [Glycine soja]
MYPSSQSFYATLPLHMQRGCFQIRNYDQLVTKESMSESSCQENGFVAVENVKSSYITNNGSLSTDLSKDTALPSIVDDPLLTEDSAKQCSVKQVAEPELNIDAPNAASVSWKWNEEDIDAPSILEAYTCVADSVFPIKVEDFFRYLFSDDALNFLESFRQKCGDKDFRCSSWHPQEKFGYARELSFQHPIKIYLGAKFGGCHEVQKFRVYRNRAYAVDGNGIVWVLHLVIETSQEVSDVPYADYFRVENIWCSTPSFMQKKVICSRENEGKKLGEREEEGKEGGLWSVERDKDESKECCFLRMMLIHNLCPFISSKQTIIKLRMQQLHYPDAVALRFQNQTCYALAISDGEAHEMLKQKNLEKQAQNGEINLDREVKTGESSEGSQEQSNHTKILATSNAFDATTHNVGSHLQGNFIEPSSVPLFKEFMTKFRSSLRSHSNLSLLLITVVALIFFIQQCSILVLLARPQHIHMNTPVDITNRMNNEVTRSPSDIAWLEKRIHHLKDEMYMVESRLERMRGGCGKRFFFFFVEELATIVVVNRRLPWCIEEASAKSNATATVEGASSPSIVEENSGKYNTLYPELGYFRLLKNQSAIPLTLQPQELFLSKEILGTEPLPIIMVRTRGLGCVLGHITNRGVGRGDRDDSDDAPQRPQSTASARRQRVAITAEHDEPVVPVTEAVGASVEPIVYADEPMARGDVHDTGADTPADTGTQAVEDEAEGFLGGPSDPSVLTEYADHVAGSVWTGEERPELKLSSHGRKVHSLGRPIPAIKGLVVGTGLSLLIACSIDTGDRRLLSSFVER